MTRQRDLAESAAHERRRLVRACFATSTATDGLDARRALRRVAGGALVALLLVVAVLVRVSLVGDAADSREDRAPPAGAGVSPSRAR